MPVTVRSTALCQLILPAATLWSVLSVLSVLSVRESPEKTLPSKKKGLDESAHSAQQRKPAL
jgi:hypothetical protein